jgi:chemotaxis protein MotB
VAYADFVTAMMAFFMVMWITAQSRPVKTAIAQYFKNPYGSANSTKGEYLYLSEKPGEKSLMVQPEIGLGGAGIGPADSRPKPLKGGKGKGPGSRKPNVFVLHDGQHEAAGTVVLFAVASAELSNDGKEQLQRLVPTLLGKRSKIEIRGHATRDPLPPGSPFQDAWQLCYARCLATRKYLEQAGVETDRMRLSQAGVFEPYTIRENLEKQNSRVEIYVLPERVEDLTGSAEERTERLQSP